MASNILIIDDENNVRTMIKLALEFSGYQVVTAADGPEGITAYGDGSKFDLVVLDQRMPGMSGEEVHAALRKIRSDARVLVVTAFGTIDMALASMRNGAVGFLRKPFTADTLRQAVKSALEQAPGGATESGVMGAFTRTNINGYHFSLLDSKREDKSQVRIARFEVKVPGGATETVTVKIPPYVIELVLAYADCESVPGNERFWAAVAEESLANYLWQHAELPTSNILVLDDLSQGLQRWLDNVMTVDLEGCN